MIKRSLLLCGLVCALSVPAAAITTTHSYFASVGGVTGLYDISGNQTTSSVDITGVRYTLTYDVTHSTNGVYPFYWYFGSVGGVWNTKIQVLFSNTNWQTAPTSSRFWVQVCNYVEAYDASTSISTVSAEHSYFQAPTTPGLVGLISSGRYTAVKSFSLVNPRILSVSSLSVDPSDPTGKTGVISWNSTALAPYPWDLLMADPTTMVHYANGSATTFFGVVWAFPMPTGDGFTSLSSRGITTAYSVPVDPE